MDIAMFADQQELIYLSCVWTQDVVWKPYWEQRMIGTDGKKESGKSVLSAQLDDMVSTIPS